MTPLYERIRPTNLDDVIGQPKAVAAARRLMNEGLGGQSVWLSGPSGTGKTTIARILAEQMADRFYIQELVGRAVTQTVLREIEREACLYAMGKGGRVWIINEAHGLPAAAIETLLDLCESLPKHCAIIFTTTWDGQEQLFSESIDTGPLLSRCRKIKLTNQGLAGAFAPYLRQVAMVNDLDGQPESAYVKLMQRVKNNVRAALQEIADGAMIADGGAE